MADLILYIPNHGYSISDYIYVSFLDGYYYVRDTDLSGDPVSISQSSFKISTDDSDNNIVQYTSTYTDGYVREETSTEVTTISGLDHLEGETVTVTSLGKSLGRYTVSSGSITLEQSVSSYQAGLSYSCKIKTTRLAVPPPNTYQSRIKRINETTVRHWKTQGGSAGQEYNGVEYLTDLDAEYSNRSSDSTFLTRGGFSEDGYTVIKSNDPYPMTVLATIINVELYE